jgi:selenocysteine-specific elongation factor
VIVATAGHVDHGKTTLVRALTGVDTDRLPEEKRRGISIDLGFAYLPVPGGETIGFVDVPGHERFIHNMIAGVAAIDIGLLVVAADDGVMPQTREHLSILEMLGVTRGIVAVSKVDVATEERVAGVMSDLRALLAGRPFDPIEVLSVSALQGVGIERLRGALLECHRAMRRLEASVDAGFRFIVDRAFVLAGSGTVVTGTAVAGTVAVGESLVASPRGVTARVRGIEHDHKAVTQARPGRRYALNLAGVEREQVARGQVLVSPYLHASSDRLDVEIRLAPEGEELRHRTLVHFHGGAGHVSARVVLAGRACVAPGETVFAQLHLAQPVAAFTGDRFVLRDQAARRSVAGGVVIDPLGEPWRRRIDPSPRLGALAVLEPEVAFARLMDVTADGVDVAAFGQRFGLSDRQLQRLSNRHDVVLLRGVGLLAFKRSFVDALSERIQAVLATYHGAHPHDDGMLQRALHRETAVPIPWPAFASLLKSLAGRGWLDLVRERVRLQGFRPLERIEAADWLRSIEPELAASGLRGVHRDRLLAIGSDPERAQRDLGDLVRQGALVPFKDDRYLARSAVERLVDQVGHLARMHRDGFSAAQFRDHSGIGRNLTIDLLEFLDRRGVTFRAGNVRFLRDDGGSEAPGSTAARVA